jgi:multidrug efflux pump subunit AcrA (membrane-fusion protein)
MQILCRTIPALAGLLLLAACGETPKSTLPAKPVAVHVLTAQQESVPSILQAPGTVQPRNRITLASQINGFVKEIKAQAGDTVKQGQVLAILDSRDAEGQKASAEASVAAVRAALEETRKSSMAAASMKVAAKASADLANATFARYQKLYEQRSVAPQELDEVRTRRDAASAELTAKEALAAASEDRLKQVQAQIVQAEAQANRSDVLLSWATIKAPSGGRIAERLADPGSAIFPGSVLMVLETAAKAQVLADISTADAGLLRRGLAVQIRNPEQPGSGFSGRIAEIIPVSNSASHTTQFKVDLPDGFTGLPGSFVKVEIPAGTRDIFLIPRSAIRENGQLVGVYVADSASKASFRLVKTVPYDSERLELLAGLEPGEKVITHLTDQIIDGAPLEIQQ